MTKFFNPKDGSVTADMHPQFNDYYRAKGFIEYDPALHAAGKACKANATTEADQCAAITGSGKRCSKKVVEGTMFCAQHAPKAEEAPAAEADVVPFDEGEGDADGDTGESDEE